MRIRLWLVFVLVGVLLAVVARTGLSGMSQFLVFCVGVLEPPVPPRRPGARYVRQAGTRSPALRYAEDAAARSRQGPITRCPLPHQLSRGQPAERVSLREVPRR